MSIDKWNTIGWTLFGVVIVVAIATVIVTAIMNVRLGDQLRAENYRQCISEVAGTDHTETKPMAIMMCGADVKVNRRR